MPLPFTLYLLTPRRLSFFPAPFKTTCWWDDKLISSDKNRINISLSEAANVLTHYLIVTILFSCTLSSESVEHTKKQICCDLESWTLYYAPGDFISFFLRTCLVMLHGRVEMQQWAVLEFTQCQIQVTACASTLTMSSSMMVSGTCPSIHSLTDFQFLQHKRIHPHWKKDS